jgi:transposase
LKDPVKIERAVGRIQSKHPRISRFYNVEYENENRRLTWSRRDKNYQEDEELFGCYVLRTDKLELDGEGLWNLYMTLTKAEEGFRCIKTYLGLRPIRHHTDIRSDAHVFISILAYHLLRNILYTLETNGDTRNWDTIKGILSTHCYTTIHVPTKEDGTYRIRKAGIPNEMQKGIYKILGVAWKNLPTKIDRHTKL